MGALGWVLNLGFAGSAVEAGGVITSDTITIQSASDKRVVSSSLQHDQFTNLGDYDLATGTDVGLVE